MPRIYSGSPATTTALTSDTLRANYSAGYTLAMHGHSGSYVDVALQGAFDGGFDPVWAITTVTACAGGATGSSRYAVGTDYFPFKRCTITLSASVAAAAASPFEVWLENLEF